MINRRALFSFFAALPFAGAIGWREWTPVYRNNLRAIYGKYPYVVSLDDGRYRWPDSSVVELLPFPDKLRARSLMVERQCATCPPLTLQIKTNV